MSNKHDAFLDLISQAVDAQVLKKSAEAGQVTLGELIAKLQSADPAKIIKVDGANPSFFDSYRGYYDHLSIVVDKKEMTVSEFLKEAMDALGKTFQGYKGGDFKMTKMTPIWVSQYGECSGIGVVDVDVSGAIVILKTANIDD